MIGIRWIPVILLLARSTAFAGDDQNNRATLRGIKTVCVVAEIGNVPDEERAGLTARLLQMDAEDKLLDAGLSLNPDAVQCLYLHVSLVQAVGGKNRKPTGLFAGSFRVEFLQTVTLTRANTIKTFAPTWSAENLATIPAGELRTSTREILASLVAKFIAAYRSANPQ